MYRHYVRPSIDGIIRYGFCDVEQEQIIGDICIDENAPRQFNLKLQNDKGQYIYKVVNGQMVLRTDAEMFDLAQYKLDKISSFSEICRSEILKDFTSNALGTIHTYGFDEIDQKNIQGIGINLAIDTTLTSADWKTRESVSMITHTRDQMVQVIKDAATHQKTSQYKYLNLKKQILQAIDKASIDAIVW